MNKKEKHKSKNKKFFINNHYNNKTKQNRIQSIIFSKHFVCRNG